MLSEARLLSGIATRGPEPGLAFIVASAPRGRAPPDGDPFGLLGFGFAGPGERALRDLAAGAEAVRRGRFGDAGAAGLSAGAAGLSAGAAGPAETCFECGGPVRRGGCPGDLATCGACGYVADPCNVPDVEAPAPAGAGRLRIVGVNSAPLQPDLHRSGAPATPAMNERALFEEICAYNFRHVAAGGTALPLDVCRAAAAAYLRVLRGDVSRAQNKLRIIAACVRHASLERAAISCQDIASTFRLRKSGFAEGQKFLRARLEAAGTPAPSGARSEISAILLRLAVPPDDTRFADAVLDIVSVADASHIGLHSTIRSKVAGAAFSVQRRCRDRLLVPQVRSLPAFCAVINIRPNTLNRFLDSLAAHHSLFVPCYIRAGLDPDP